MSWTGHVLLLLCCCCCAAVEETPEVQKWYQEQRHLYFGVPVHLRFKGGNAELAEAVWKQLESVDDYFNDYRDDSEIGRINGAGRGVYTVSPSMQLALQRAFQVHVTTAGTFDISVGPLRRLWKEAASNGVYPDEAVIEEARRRVGLQHYYLQDDQLHVLRDGTALDFGGIIKGHAVDQAMVMLQQAGVKDAMVQVGGETASMGMSPRGTRHVFAIPNPLQVNECYQIIEDPGTGYSGCTSGNYRQPIMINNKPFYHIFDPRTGRPCDLHVLSVSVVFPRTGCNALADALSTSGVVLGPERFIQLVEQLGGDCLILIADKKQTIKEHTSKGWQHYVRD